MEKEISNGKIQLDMPKKGSIFWKFKNFFSQEGIFVRYKNRDFMMEISRSINQKKEAQ